MRNYYTIMALFSAFLFCSFYNLERQMNFNIETEVLEKVDSVSAFVSDWLLTSNHISTELKESAIQTYRETGIPASIILSQWRLESVLPTGKYSGLVEQTNNPFNIKCLKHGMKQCKVHRACKEGECLIRDKKFGDCCTPFKNDHECDRFKNFETIQEGFKVHLNILAKQRYKELFNVAPELHKTGGDLRGTYKGWTEGLERLGYATDPRYSEKLDSIIGSAELWKLDLVVLNERYRVLHFRSFAKS